MDFANGFKFSVYKIQLFLDEVDVLLFEIDFVCEWFRFCQTQVRALSDYKGQEDDELTFCKDAVITDVVKEDGGWQV